MPKGGKGGGGSPPVIGGSKKPAGKPAKGAAKPKSAKTRASRKRRS